MTEYIGGYKKKDIYALLGTIGTKNTMWRDPKITLPKILMQLIEAIEAIEDDKEHTPPQA